MNESLSKYYNERVKGNDKIYSISEEFQYIDLENYWIIKSKLK
jgi:hypothetical protein